MIFYFLPLLRIHQHSAIEEVHRSNLKHNETPKEIDQIFPYFAFYRTKEPVSLPPNHCVEHRIVRTDLDMEGNLVKLEEDAAAHVNPLQDHGNVLKIRVSDNTLKAL